MIDETLFDAEEKMEKAVEVAKEDFAGIRTGRVSRLHQAWRKLFSAASVRLMAGDAEIVVDFAACDKTFTLLGVERRNFHHGRRLTWPQQPRQYGLGQGTGLALRGGQPREIHRFLRQNHGRLFL